jgi:hypothetical protein
MLVLLVATTKILEVKAETSLNLAHLPARTGPPALCLVCVCSSREEDFLMCLKQSSYFSYVYVPVLLVATAKILEAKAETSLNLAHLPCQPACPNRPTCLVSCLCLFLA